MPERLDYFAAAGCFVSDHVLDTFIYEECSEEQQEKILATALQSKNISAQDDEGWQTALLCFLAGEYKKRDIVMRLHFNCQRNINTAMYDRLGRNTGFDSIDISASASRHGFSTRSNKMAVCPNPSFTPYIHKTANLSTPSSPGLGDSKMQHGSVWWFNDTKDSMRLHLQMLSEYGVLMGGGNFLAI